MMISTKSWCQRGNGRFSTWMTYHYLFCSEIIIIIINILFTPCMYKYTEAVERYLQGPNKVYIGGILADFWGLMKKRFCHQAFSAYTFKLYLAIMYLCSYDIDHCIFFHFFHDWFNSIGEINHPEALLPRHTSVLHSQGVFDDLVSKRVNDMCYIDWLNYL